MNSRRGYLRRAIRLKCCQVSELETGGGLSHLVRLLFFFLHIRLFFGDFIISQNWGRIISVTLVNLNGIAQNARLFFVASCSFAV